MPIDYTKGSGSQGRGVGLSKVTLTKNAPTVSLSKQQGGSAGGELRVNLNWNSRPASGGLFKRQAQGIDLDLACLYELSNGQQGGAPIEIQLDEADPSARTCAIALLESTGADLSVRREVRYVKGTQSALDAAYGWGMNWTKGRK